MKVIPRSVRLGCIASVTLWVSSMSLSVPEVGAQTPGQEVRLWGTLKDGLTGVSVEHAVVRAGSEWTTTGDDGGYSLDIPDEEFVLEVFARLPNGRIEIARQPHLQFAGRTQVYRPIVLITDAYLEDHPMLESGIGVPWPYPRPESLEGQPIDLLELWWSRHSDQEPSALSWLELPDVLPEEIRVGRRFASSCSGNPIVQIDTVDLETYAAGVVTAEIGVFRNLTTGEQSAHECFKTFSIAALSYALWFWARDPDAEYHLDDTACNQRYIDGPYPDIIVRAVQETTGMFLVQEGTPSTIDKYEYASSCGRNGTLPEYTEEIVQDEVPGIVACTTGGWCGHNNCAGHQDNPDLPGEDRCLVRGICQWGAVERSIRGDDYLAILEHYQPYLDIRWVGEPPAARLLGFVREQSIQVGEDIPDARVELDTGEVEYSDSYGLFTFEDVQPGLRTLWVTAVGYQSAERTKEVLPGIDNWASVVMNPVEEPLDPDWDADVGPPIDGGDVFPPVDGGIEEGPFDVETEEIDAGGLEDRADPSEHPASPPALSRFTMVGPEQADEGGCNQAHYQVLGGPMTGAALLMMALLVGFRRRQKPAQ